MNKIIVIKLGGSVLGSRDTALEDIARLRKEGYFPVVVRGGAAVVNSWLLRLNIPTKIVQGERVTDEQTLDVVTAVLAGLVNKETTAKLLEYGVMAVGISGVDGDLIRGQPRSNWGYMGDVARVDPTLINILLNAGMVPVVSPVSFSDIEDKKPLLNINGDPVAGELAAALNADKLIFLTDVPGIKDANGNLINSTTAQDAEALISSGVVTGGMVPKIRAASRAAAGGTITSIVDGREPNILYNEVTRGGLGTLIGA